MKFPNVDSLPRSLLVGFLAELLFIECLIYLSSLGQLRAEGQQLETRHGSALQRPLSGKASSNAKRTRERKTTASRAGFRNWKSSFFMKQKTTLSKRWKRSCLEKRGRFLAEAKTQAADHEPIVAAMKEDKT